MVTRYTLLNEGRMDPDPHGEWVLYEEHAATVALAAHAEPSKGHNDGRAATYRVRLTLFKDGTLMADSDPELPMNTAGTEVIKGLAAVGAWARAVAEGYHSQETTGLDDIAILKSIKSLRPSLSRNSGTHNWRMPYYINDQAQWLMNILVVTEPPEPTTP